MPAVSREPTDYGWVTTEMFDRKLREIVVREGANLVTVPGVYECVLEHFNNQILEEIEEDRNEGDSHA